MGHIIAALSYLSQAYPESVKTRQTTLLERTEFSHMDASHNMPFTSVFQRRGSSPFFKNQYNHIFGEHTKKRNSMNSTNSFLTIFLKFLMLFSAFYFSEALDLITKGCKNSSCDSRISLCQFRKEQQKIEASPLYAAQDEKQPIRRVIKICGFKQHGTFQDNGKKYSDRHFIF